jgi:adenosylcobinamide kinase/adenosylcobinamide-phosphate guanylyltransferase
MLKILYYGGQKSGKSRLAEKKALNLAKDRKPYYIATYNSGYGDSEMLKRVSKHKKDRENRFNTIEESLNLVGCIKEGETYLIDCISMWILNSLNRDEDELIKDIDEIAKIDANIVFVLNSVNEGVTPLGRESRRFVDLTGIIGQRLASISDEVYDVKLGIESRLK